MNVFKREDGFTLAELVMGMGILSIIMAGFYGVLTMSITSYQHSVEKNTNVAVAQEVMLFMGQEIQNATTIAIPNASEIDYTISAQGRRIYVGTGENANSIVYEVNNVVMKVLAKNRVKQLAFAQDAAQHRKITMTLNLQNQAKLSSPVANYSNTIVVLNNIP